MAFHDFSRNGQRSLRLLELKLSQQTLLPAYNPAFTRTPNNP